MERTSVFARFHCTIMKIDILMIPNSQLNCDNFTRCHMIYFWRIPLPWELHTLSFSPVREIPRQTGYWTILDFGVSRSYPVDISSIAREKIKDGEANERKMLGIKYHLRTCNLRYSEKKLLLRRNILYLSG